MFPAFVAFVMIENSIDKTIVSRVDSIGLGSYYAPWILRIKEGDPWALAELTMECFHQNVHRIIDERELAILAIPQIQSMLASNPGKANYYLAEMKRFSNGYTKGEQPGYVDLLEISSKYGYAFADYKLYRECQPGGLYLEKYPNKRTKEELKAIREAELAWIQEANSKGKENMKTRRSDIGRDINFEEWKREHADQFRRRAVERLIPLAKEGDMDACSALISLLGKPLPGEIQTNLDELCTNSQVRRWIEEAAKRGSIKAQDFIAWGHVRSPKRLEDFSENTHEFQAIAKIAKRHDPDAIQEIVDYYCEKKNWPKAQYWASKGREALGQSNEWLDRAWNEGDDEGDGD